MTNPLLFLLLLVFLLGSCTAMAGNVSHWPASLIAVCVIVVMKFANDRFKVVGWPMEFLLVSAVTMIVINLGRLYLLEPAF